MSWEYFTRFPRDAFKGPLASNAVQERNDLSRQGAEGLAALGGDKLAGSWMGCTSAVRLQASMIDPIVW